MKKIYLAAALLLAAVPVASAQTPWSDSKEFTTYTDANNPVHSGGNNMLQGAEFKASIMNDSWQELSGGPHATYSGNSFTTGRITYKAPQGRGSQQWTAQMSFTTNYRVEKSKKYDLCFHVKSTAANDFTVKIEDTSAPDSKHMGYTYVKLPADKELLFVLHNVSPSTDISEARLMFDAGGAVVGSTIEIYDIIFQSSDELSGPATPTVLNGAPEGYVMVWNDEFDNASTLTTNWNAMDWPAGNVNNELQTYKPSTLAIKDDKGNTRHTGEVSNGTLKINLFKGQDGKYYSGRFDSHDSKGNHSGYAAWRYGYMEARIKLPKGSGTWPAFWMMPEGVNWSDETWPTCGEIDIMEEVGNDPNNCVCSLHAIGHYHANNTQVSASRHVDNMEGGWVTYAMLWDNDNIAMYADGKRVLSYANDHNGHVNWPYDRPYYITLNLAWGGGWGGAGGVNPAALPVAMEVDYVRVYQLPAPAMKADGSGVAYIQGPFNGVAPDGIVPSSTFNSWYDNFITLEDNGSKTYTKEFRVGKNLHPDRVDFMFYATADRAQGTEFSPSNNKYKVTLKENPVLSMSFDGHLRLKEGVKLLNGQTVKVTLDCSAGTDKAVISVDYNEEIVLPPAPKKNYYIIGALNSISPAHIGTTNDAWDWATYYVTMEQDADNGYLHRHTFKIGHDLDPVNVNFKFMPQNSWNGGQFGADNQWNGYTVSHTGEYFMLGTGKNGHDNGNVVLQEGRDLKAFDTVTVTLDVSGGEDNAVFTSDIESSAIDNIISDSDSDMQSDRWYDLSGRPISRPTAPGFYINGRRKVVIR